MSTIPPLALSSTWGSVSRTGRWQVPDSITVTSTMGSILLDFTAADCPHQQVEVRVSCQAGKVTLIVPADWAVDANELVAGGAGVTVTGEHRGDPGMPLLHVTGRVVWGGVLITDPQGARTRDDGGQRRRERHDRHRDRHH
ncbi:LiaF domain-containing protein [Nocardia sp. CS682]|uniref:LiaF domain-containing protein n=1 Tax=Nocardia sp. CS682 TaxID=1047172 RepID=UPI0010750DA8|nr:LiaF domain-containing protein [Nocardia sp. CS682]QBS45061.1 hypothetical protein DMB37_38215 [Nocardia sp. CS682]